MFDFVEIEIDGEKINLKPSAGAMFDLASKYGDLAAVMRKCASFDPEVSVEILIAGHEPFRSLKRKEVNEMLFNAGIIEIMPTLMKFVNLLMSGGKFPKEEAEKEDVKKKGNS